MFHAADRVTGAILWANLHLLFWLSLVPFTTGWMGENRLAPLPTAVYGANLLCCGLAYTFVQRAIIASQGPRSRLAAAVGGDGKGKLSAVLYTAAVPLAYVNHWIAKGIFVLVAALWLIPDRRIEARLTHDGTP